MIAARPAGRGPRETRGSWRPTSAAPRPRRPATERRARPGEAGMDVNAPVLAIEGLTAGYDGAAGAPRPRPARRAGRGGRAARPERRREDHDAANDLGPRAPVGRRDPPQREGSAAVQPPRGPGSASLTCPKDAASSSGSPSPSTSASATGRTARHRRRVPVLPGARPARDRRGGLLSGGEQQMLARRTGAGPPARMMLLDELWLGLAPVIVEDLLPVVPNTPRRAAAGCSSSSSTSHSRWTSPTAATCSPTASS